jgi:hypothetical protein
MQAHLFQYRINDLGRDLKDQMYYHLLLEKRKVDQNLLTYVTRWILEKQRMILVSANVHIVLNLVIIKRDVHKFKEKGHVTPRVRDNRF